MLQLIESMVFSDVLVLVGAIGSACAWIMRARDLKASDSAQWDAIESLRSEQTSIRERIAHIEGARN